MKGTAALCSSPLFSVLQGIFPFSVGVEGVIVPAVQALLDHFEGLGEALVVHDFPLPQEAQHVDHVRVVGQAEKVVVGGAGLLLWYDLARTTYESFSEVPMYFNRNVFRLRNAFSYANMVNQHFYSFAG